MSQFRKKWKRSCYDFMWLFLENMNQWVYGSCGQENRGGKFHTGPWVTQGQLHYRAAHLSLSMRENSQKLHPGAVYTTCRQSTKNISSSPVITGCFVTLERDLMDHATFWASWVSRLLRFFLGGGSLSRPLLFSFIFFLLAYLQEGVF